MKDKTTECSVLSAKNKQSEPSYVVIDLYREIEHWLHAILQDETSSLKLRSAATARLKELNPKEHITKG